MAGFLFAAVRSHPLQSGLPWGYILGYLKKRTFRLIDMARAFDKLSALLVKNAKPKERTYTLADGGNLYLLVEPNGARYWHPT